MRFILVNVQISALGLLTEATECPACSLWWCWDGRGRRLLVEEQQIPDPNVLGTSRLWTLPRNKPFLGTGLRSSHCSALFFGPWVLCGVAWIIWLQVSMLSHLGVDWPEPSLGVEKLRILSWCFSCRGQVSFLKVRFLPGKGGPRAGKAETCVEAGWHSLCALCAGSLAS